MGCVRPDPQLIERFGKPVFITHARPRRTNHDGGENAQGERTDFLANDPLGFDGNDANLYRYVGNDPTNATDPSGLKIVRIRDIYGLGKLVVIPDSYNGNIKDYISEHFDITAAQAGAAFVDPPIEHQYHPVSLTPLEQKLADAAKGNEAAEREVAQLLNQAEDTVVPPAIPILGYFFPDTFGSQCVRWTNALMGPLLDSKDFGKFVLMRQVTLRYPVTGGPEHSVILVKLRGSRTMVGIDNGFLSGRDQLFDPLKVINDPSQPKEAREDLEAAFKEFRGGN